MTGRRGRRRKQLLVDLRKKILETERRSNRSHNVENLFWKRLWTCLERDYTIFFMYCWPYLSV